MVANSLTFLTLRSGFHVVPINPGWLCDYLIKHGGSDVVPVSWSRS